MFYRSSGYFISINMESLFPNEKGDCMKIHRHTPDTASDIVEHPIVLFDGECRFCNGWVKFLLRRDKRDVFRFAPLQSEAARAMLPTYLLKDDSLDSVMVVEPNDIYTHSSAVLRIAKHLGGPWAILYALIVVPIPLRDAAYRWVAKRRYTWFGREESCMMPSEETKRKFIG